MGRQEARNQGSAGICGPLDASVEQETLDASVEYETLDTAVEHVTEKLARSARHGAP